MSNATPINPARTIELDERDWRACRDRILALEERTAKIDEHIVNLQLVAMKNSRELALFMMRAKERLDEHRDLLARLEARLAQLEPRP